MSRPGEFDLIARYFAPLAADLGAFGLTDDAAVLTPQSGHDLVVTTDALVEGIHFLPPHPPGSVARKALRVNLSDLAAMGASPLTYTLALALPERIDENWVAAFARGLAEDQATYGISLIGGDTVRTSGPVTISVTAIGSVPSGKALRRNGASPGDHIYVSGTIGDSWLGLASLNGNLAIEDREARDFLEDRYFHPCPRTGLGPKLVGIASACMDVSDGLVGDLEHMCRASACGARFGAKNVPMSKAAKGVGEGALLSCLTGGDDYELLIAVRPEQADALIEIAAEVGESVSRIGSFVEGQKIAVMNAVGEEIPLPTKSWRHF